MSGNKALKESVRAREIYLYDLTKLASDLRSGNEPKPISVNKEFEFRINDATTDYLAGKCPE